VWFTTVFVFIFVGLCQTNIALPIPLSSDFWRITNFLWFIRFLLIQYTTTKTFKDWYGDHPMDTLDDEI
jgi:hypothetical protein